MATPRKANPQKPPTKPGLEAAKRYAQKGNALTAAIVASSGDTPLDVMLLAMRGLVEQAEKTAAGPRRSALMVRAAAVAKDAAPYVHPKLASVELKGNLNLSFADRLVKARERAAQSS